MTRSANPTRPARPKRPKRPRATEVRARSAPPLALPPVPVGDIALYDNYVPVVYGGDYAITVTHEAPDVLTTAATATQRFTVSAPQFAIDASEIVQLYPPDGSTGQFADVLPFVVFATPELPWERQMSAPGAPWLALLVLDQDEIIGGTGAARTTTTTVDDFLGLTGVFVPPISRESDVPGTLPCSYLQLSATTFTAVTPRLAETRYLSHVRVVNTGDKALGSTAPDGTFSVVAANRFPAAAVGGQPARALVHLVSIEGLGPWLVDHPVFTRSGEHDGSPTFDTVAVLSLASWTFQAQADPAENFAGLALALLENEYDPTASAHHPDKVWLRLPPPGLDASVPANAEINRRVADGFVPLSYQTRSAESTMAWYRGPLTPVLTGPVTKPGPYLSSDQAMAYDPAYGVFDLSLSAAWQVGRLAAIADRSFGQALYEFRRRLHRLTDQLADRLARDHFDTPADIAELAASGLLASNVLGILRSDLLPDASLLPDAGGRPRSGPVRGGLRDDPDPKTALINFLAEPANQDAIIGMVGDDLVPVARWLAQLLLLEPVPFEHLVAHPALLPLTTPSATPGAPPVTGSVRFFYVDANWTGALLDGATSIGLDSSLQTFFHQMTAGIVAQAAAEAAAAYRSTLLGLDPGPGPAGVVAGMLLRSPMVSGWPNLAVRPLAADGATVLKTLRMDRLGSGVLLCLFDGVPASVLISEPQEGARFGTDEQGAIQLRNLTDAASATGSPIGTPMPVRALAGPPTPYLRADNRVLNLLADQGLVPAVVSALDTLGQTVTAASFGPAAFALQILKTPEEITFVSKGA